MGLKMSKFYKFKLKQDTHFGQEKVEAGTVLAVLRVDVEAADPIQLLSMVNYRQVEVESVEVESKEPDVDPTDDEPESSEDVDTQVDGDVDVDTEQPEGGDLDLDGNDDADSESESSDSVSVDLASIGLEESVIESLHANQINNVQELAAYINSGKDLLDLDKIGASRKAKILTAMGRN